jgi:hypothetical protein
VGILDPQSGCVVSPGRTQHSAGAFHMAVIDSQKLFSMRELTDYKRWSSPSASMGLNFPPKPL